MAESQVPTDKQILLLLRSAATREKGFSLLLAQYQVRVYWQVRRMVESHEDADDISQEVWIRVFRSIDSFKGDSALYTWIYRIAVNLSINHLKQMKNRNEKIKLLPDENTVLENDIGEKAIWEILQKAVMQLPEKQQLVFNMRYFEEMKYDDISKTLGTSVGALKASYHLAVKKVEAYVREKV